MKWGLFDYSHHFFEVYGRQSGPRHGAWAGSVNNGYGISSTEIIKLTLLTCFTGSYVQQLYAGRAVYTKN